jgi:hypothetical protein
VTFIGHGHSLAWLAFSKAIILLEEGCSDFSNIHGLRMIPFSKGDIRSCFEEVVAFLSVRK